MNNYLKRTDRNLVIALLLLGLCFLNYPLLEDVVRRHLLSGGFSKLNGRPVKIKDVTILFPKIVKESKQQIYLNQAGKEKLTEIEGIGPVLAGRILNYREENGPLESLSELAKVDGIGAVTIENCRKNSKVLLNPPE